MSAWELDPMVITSAFGFYAVIVAVVMVFDRREPTGRRHESGPGANVADDGWAQALIGQVLGGHREGHRRRGHATPRPLREIAMQDRGSADEDRIAAVLQHL